MIALIVTLSVGVLICVLGVINMSGNISSLHSYHRHRVREEDKRIFGRLVGIGNILIGLSVVAFGVLYFIYEMTAALSCITAGTVTLIAGMVLGLGISFYAMIKYNKGIF